MSTYDWEETKRNSKWLLDLAKSRVAMCLKDAEEATSEESRASSLRSAEFFRREEAEHQRFYDMVMRVDELDQANKRMTLAQPMKSWWRSLFG
jgi:hypothetical protein